VVLSVAKRKEEKKADYGENIFLKYTVKEKASNLAVNIAS